MRFRSSIKSKFASSIILCIIGFIFVAIAIGLNINDYIKKDIWDECEATITFVDHFDEVVKISYTYKEETYICTSSSYSSFNDEGEILIIYVNPENPTEIYEAQISIIFIIFYCVGGFIFLIGIFSVISDIKSKNNSELCMNEGSRKVVDVLEVTKTNFYYNNEPYYLIKIIYRDKEYKSERFFLPETINLNAKLVVDLYYIDEKRYYIDFSSLREKDEFDF